MASRQANLTLIKEKLSGALDASEETPGPNVRNDSDSAKVIKSQEKMPTTGIEDFSSLKVPVVVGTDQLIDDSFDSPANGSGKHLNQVNNSISLAKLLKKAEKSYGPEKEKRTPSVPRQSSGDRLRGTRGRFCPRKWAGTGSCAPRKEFVPLAL